MATSCSSTEFSGEGNFFVKRKHLKGFHINNFKRAKNTTETLKNTYLSNRSSGIHYPELSDKKETDQSKPLIEEKQNEKDSTEQNKNADSELNSSVLIADAGSENLMIQEIAVPDSASFSVEKKPKEPKKKLYGHAALASAAFIYSLIGFAMLFILGGGWVLFLINDFIEVLLSGIFLSVCALSLISSLVFSTITLINFFKIDEPTKDDKLELLFAVLAILLVFVWSGIAAFIFLW